MNDSPPHPPRLLKAYAACAKWSLWLLAAFWLLLALAWGALHGWIVPRISEWRPMLEAQATRALGGAGSHRRGQRAQRRPAPDGRIRRRGAAGPTGA
jgi:hypothetical protein